MVIRYGNQNVAVCSFDELYAQKHSQNEIYFRKRCKDNKDNKPIDDCRAGAPRSHTPVTVLMGDTCYGDTGTVT